MNLKHYEIVIDQDKLKVDLQQVFMEYKTIKKWAYILHDKDETRPHYHIYINFGKQSVDSALVAKWFNLAYTDKNGNEHTGENFIEKVKGRSTDVFLYLIHGNDTQQYKHQYSPSEVTANFDFGAEIANSKIIGHFDEYSYAQQIDYVENLPISEKRRAFDELEKLWKLRCKWLSLHTDRNIEVIFVTGAGGTGKTYYTKKLLKSMGLDFCVSSSSNDIMQDYLGQKALILDDCRDKTFHSFEDCLKFLDNHTSSSVQSRFANKVFNGDLIAITSATELFKWFHGRDNSGNYYNLTKEDFKQFYRRISCYVEVTKEEIFVYHEIDENGKPKGVAQVFKNELSDKQKEKSTKRDFGSLFGKICESATTDVFDIEQQRITGTEKERVRKSKV